MLHYTILYYDMLHCKILSEVRTMASSSAWPRGGPHPEGPASGWVSRRTRFVRRFAGLSFVRSITDINSDLRFSYVRLHSFCAHSSSPQISAILRKTSRASAQTNVRIPAGKIPYCSSPPCELWRRPFRSDILASQTFSRLRVCPLGKHLFWFGQTASE